MNTILKKIETWYQLPIKLLMIFILKIIIPKTAKHYHTSIEILIPVLGKLKLFLTDKELIIPQGSLYIINSQEIMGCIHTEDTDIYKGMHFK